MSTRTALGVHIKETLLLATPVIIGQLGHVAINQADTIMVGSIDATNLAAATLANGLWILPAIAGIGMFVAVSALCAQWIGANRSTLDMSRLLQQSVLLSLWVGLIVMGAQLALTELIAHPIMNQKPHIVALAQPYFRIVAVSSVPMIVFLAFRNFIEGFEKMVPGMIIMGIMVILNIIFNWVFIHGHFGFPPLGLNGAGYATLLSRIIGMLIIAFYVYRTPQFRPYWPQGRFFIHQWAVMKEIIRIGLPSGMQYFFEVGAFSGAVVLAGWIGEDALSAHQIAIGIASLTFMFYLGISVAASIRVGNAKGRNDLADMRLAGRAGIICGLGFIALFVTLMLLLRTVLPQLYIDEAKEAQVVELAIPLLLIACVFQVFDGVQAIGVGILRGMSDVTIPTIITFIAYWVIGLPSAYFLMQVTGLGLEGIWYGLTAGLAFSAVFMTVRFAWKSRRKLLPTS